MNAKVLAKQIKYLQSSAWDAFLAGDLENFEKFGDLRAEKKKHLLVLRSL